MIWFEGIERKFDGLWRCVRLFDSVWQCPKCGFEGLNCGAAAEIAATSGGDCQTQPRRKDNCGDTQYHSIDIPNIEL